MNKIQEANKKLADDLASLSVEIGPNTSQRIFHPRIATEIAVAIADHTHALTIHMAELIREELRKLPNETKGK